MVRRATPSIDQSTALFKAFADPTRLRLLNLLRDGERCVCDLVDVIGGPQPRVSRHLAYLRKAGLVRTRKQGLWVHYRLAEPTSDLHRRLVDCVGQCFGDVKQFEQDRKKLAQCCGRGGAVSTDSACDTGCC